MDDNELREKLLDELRDTMDGGNIPPGAFTVEDAIRATGAGRDRTRDTLNKLVREGKWAKVKRGSAYYYYKLEGQHGVMSGKANETE